MNTISCLIQADGPAAGLREELERRLRAHHAGHLDGEEAVVSWRLVEPGHMFTAGSPSSSAVITCTMAGPTTRSGREAYMRRICDFWTEVTGCTDHEIVVSITETGGASPKHTEERS
ncbi:MAG: hypothetical protein AAGD18_21450 [Actinomycetota bacterium]